MENDGAERLRILVADSCFARPAPERLHRTVLGRPSGSVFASLRRDTRDDLGLLEDSLLQNLQSGGGRALNPESASQKPICASSAGLSSAIVAY